MDVLTGSGALVTTKPGDDMFDTFPNSYGSLGYATRLRIELERVPAYVELQHVRFDDAATLTQAVSRIVDEREWQGRRVDGVDGVAFSPDGGLIAGAGDRTVRVWRVGDRNPAAVLAGRDERDRLKSVAFDASGELLAAGGSSGAAEIWEVRTKRRTARISGHGEEVAAVGFSADGPYLVTVGHDGIANVWAMPSGHLVTAVRTRVSSLEAAAFAPRGRELAVAGAEGRVTVFECAECRPLDSLVCLAASRLTPQVRAREHDAFASCD
jgi:WD40 repeat protein